MRNIKAQTALEYLMTYGWAILIVIIVIAALYLGGFTKPCRWTGTQIREFGDFKVDLAKMTTTQLSFDFSRLKPDTVTVTNIAVSGDANATDATAFDATTTAGRRTITLGSNTRSAGDCYSVSMTIAYRVVTAGGNQTFTTAGTIQGTVEP